MCSLNEILRLRLKYLDPVSILKREDFVRVVYGYRDQDLVISVLGSHTVDIEPMYDLSGPLGSFITTDAD